jgi:spore coat polysaccharide biosynthesis protein SpsF
VTADNPFTDPDSIDRIVDAIAIDGAEYAAEKDLPIGTTAEALTWNALSYIDSVAVSQPHREHVTLYAKENPQALHCAFLEARPPCRRPDLTFTVDRLEEYLYAREMADRFDTIDFELKTLVAVADEAVVRSVSA